MLYTPFLAKENSFNLHTSYKLMTRSIWFWLNYKSQKCAIKSTVSIAPLEQKQQIYPQPCRLNRSNDPFPIIYLISLTLCSP